MIANSQTEIHLRGALDHSQARGEAFLIYLIEMALLEEIRLCLHAEKDRSGRPMKPVSRPSSSSH